jgi:hypothetical protein
MENQADDRNKYDHNDHNISSHLAYLRDLRI